MSMTFQHRSRPTCLSQYIYSTSNFPPHFCIDSCINMKLTSLLAVTVVVLLCLLAWESAALPNPDPEPWGWHKKRRSYYPRSHYYHQQRPYYGGYGGYYYNSHRNYW
ncbi:hypothetical protein O3P69_013667 [Scylla paramamosain]|uniref:Uncharacterized protein n=1 Tax=Scylla paramamosain TaxID=85552 RepID=A0AAW0SP93_SCYPA